MEMVAEQEGCVYGLYNDVALLHWNIFYLKCELGEIVEGKKRKKKKKRYSLFAS
jgi:hypothetical protein